MKKITKVLQKLTFREQAWDLVKSAKTSRRSQEIRREKKERNEMKFNDTNLGDDFESLVSQYEAQYKSLQ